MVISPIQVTSAVTLWVTLVTLLVTLVTSAVTILIFSVHKKAEFSEPIKRTEFLEPIKKGEFCESIKRTDKPQILVLQNRISNT